MQAMCSLKFLFEPGRLSQPRASRLPLGCNARCITLQDAPTKSSSPQQHTSSCNESSYLTRSKDLLSRRKYEGYIPRTCTTTSSFRFFSSSSPQIRCAPSALSISSQLTSSDAPQRSDEWFSLRKDKLTTSTFSTTLGFWKGNRRSKLWCVKVFAQSTDSLSLDSAARASMDWGVRRESEAIEQYKRITGRDVSLLGFAVHAEAKFGWLGASPDGLLGCNPGGGILEVKCPYNRGKPELALPWQAMPYY